MAKDTKVHVRSVPKTYLGLPVIDGDRTTATIQVRATDTGGTSRLSEPITVELVRDERAPRLLAASISDGARLLYVANYGASIWWQEPPTMLSVEHILGGGIYRMEDDLSVFSVRASGGIGGRPLILEWFSAAGRNYQIQHSADLQGWHNALEPVAGVDGPLSVQVPAEGSTASHYYRVIILSP